MTAQNLYGRDSLPATTLRVLTILEQTLPHDRYNRSHASGHTEYRDKQNPRSFIAVRHDTTARGDVMLSIYGKGIGFKTAAELIRKLREAGHGVETGQRISDDAGIFLVSEDRPNYNVMGDHAKSNVSSSL